MAIVALIKKSGKEVASLVERIKPGDEFCFVVNQKKLGWHIAQADGRANMEDYMGEIREAGGNPVFLPQYENANKMSLSDLEEMNVVRNSRRRSLEPS